METAWRAWVEGAVFRRRTETAAIVKVRFNERAFATPSRGAVSPADSARAARRARSRYFILRQRGWDRRRVSLPPRWKWSATGLRADVMLIRDHLGESVNHATRRAAYLVPFHDAAVTTAGASKEKECPAREKAQALTSPYRSRYGHPSVMRLFGTSMI